MVNYRRVVCEAVLATVLLSVALAAPAPDCAQKHYDQRQNGSENYRLNIDGVVIAVAPAESIMSALGDMEDLLDFGSEEEKPKPPQASGSPAPAIQIVSLPTVDLKPQEQKPQEDKPAEGKPETPVKIEPAPASPLSDVSLDNDAKIQKKDASVRKHEKAQRLKNRLASLLMPLLRKARAH